MSSHLPNVCMTTTLVLGYLCGLATLNAQTEEKDTPKFTDQQLEYFEAKVRPLLVEHCYECHGPDAEYAEGGLSLATRKDLLAGGDTGPAVVPGDPADSLLFDSISYGDLYQMPPDQKLGKSDLAIIKKWIADGAAWPQHDANERSNVKESFDLIQRKQEHWCWQPIVDYSIPKVKDGGWPSDSIDYFVLNQLENEGMAPPPGADRHALLRRVYFDLIGLPPTPEQVRDFVYDDAPDAFEKVVDRLLASRHFGERWARHWLDLVRYAESYGHQYDYDMPHSYRYRDYLIRAFNNDVSYRQLIHEHIAGDLLEQPRRNSDEDFNESIMGTAFWYLGQAKPSAVDSRANEADLIDDRIDTMSKTFLGLTVSCARCHDHKFDAISTKDYYALYGFFQSSTRQLAMLDPGRKIEHSFNEIAKIVERGDKSVNEIVGSFQGIDPEKLADYLDIAINVLRNSTTGEKIELDDVVDIKDVDRATLLKLIKLIASEEAKSPSNPLHLIRLAVDSEQPINENFARQILARVKKAIKADKRWRENSTLFADFSNGLPEGWSRTGFAFNSQGNKHSNAHFSGSGEPISHAGSVDSGRSGARFYGVIRSPTFQLNDPRIHHHIRGNNVTVRVIIDGFFMDQYRDLLFREALFKMKPSNEFAWQTQDGDLKNHLGSMAHLEIIDHGDGHVCMDEIRFSKSAAPPEPSVFNDHHLLEPADYSNQRTLCASVAASITRSLNQPANARSSDVMNWVVKNKLIESAFSKNGLTTTNTSQPTDVSSSESIEQNLFQLNQVRNQIQAIANKTPKPRFSIGITDGASEDERVFIRGNHKTPGEVAHRSFLTAISNQPFDIKRGSGRLLLAEKITDLNNPLTARVAVNRVWHHLFGRGIVETVDNFGVLGKRPTHPQLLDHLALEFVQADWSIKKIIRRIVLSKTYQMSSVALPANEAIDPDNRLLHCANVRRLQSEAIRDSVLAVSGRLDRTMFGKPIPVHLTSFMTGRGRPRNSGPIDGNGRRTIYISVRRNFMSPMMLAFDAPIPISTTGRRNLSNVPAQALIMMNSPFVNEQATVWANRLVKDEQTLDQRVGRIYMEAMSRHPSQFELDEGQRFIRTLAEEMKIPENEIAGNEKLWREYCHVIFNLKEFIFLN